MNGRKIDWGGGLIGRPGVEVGTTVGVRVRVDGGRRVGDGDTVGDHINVAVLVGVGLGVELDGDKILTAISVVKLLMFRATVPCAFAVTFWILLTAPV